jgi:hypothetical protein
LGVQYDDLHNASVFGIGDIQIRVLRYPQVLYMRLVNLLQAHRLSIDSTRLRTSSVGMKMLLSLQNAPAGYFSQRYSLMNPQV